MYVCSFKTPGPGAYKPENTGQMGYYKAPQYSFGSRHRHRKSDNTPAPNNYTLPGMYMYVSNSVTVVICRFNACRQ